MIKSYFVRVCSLELKSQTNIHLHECESWFVSFTQQWLYKNHPKINFVQVFIHKKEYVFTPNPFLFKVFMKIQEYLFYPKIPFVSRCSMKTQVIPTIPISSSRRFFFRNLSLFWESFRSYAQPLNTPFPCAMWKSLLVALERRQSFGWKWWVKWSQ